MAEESQGQEKTEDATPKRLRDARKKGQVAKSRDMNTVVILIAAFALVVVMIPYFYKNMEWILLGSFKFANMENISEESLLQFLSSSFWVYIKAIAPFILILALIAIAVGFFQIGPIFSAEPLKPQFKRLNIVENLKNMAKVTTLVELIKNILKVVLIFYLAYVVIHTNLEQLLLTVTSDLTQSTEIAGALIAAFMIRVFILFSIIAILDVMVQRWQYKKQLRMTKEEVKREYKQDEGDPIIKSVRRQLHQELAMGDTRRAVASSDAVITNPTELAIAIKYKEQEMMAPTITAKGQRLFAETIKEYAKEAGVPIIQNIPLAWSLIELDVDAEIPEELYQAVAEILIVIYRMRERQQTVSPSRRS